MKIEGRGVPYFNRKENLAKIVRAIAWQSLGLRIPAAEFSSAKRVNLAPRAPILVKYE